MDFTQEFSRIMAEQTQIALATCTEGHPNVRIVNFCCDSARKGVIYFSTFSSNQKVIEFQQNSKVAFSTIPSTGNAHVRVKNAIVQKSEQTIYDLRDAFVQKIPEYEMTIKQAGKYLVLYELNFEEADVTVDMKNRDSITL